MMKSDAIILNEAMAALSAKLNHEETLESLSRKAQTYYENKPPV